MKFGEFLKNAILVYAVYTFIDKGIEKRAKKKAKKEAKRLKKERSKDDTCEYNIVYHEIVD